MFCEKCGATMPDDSMFCEKCGARVQPENTAGSNTAGNAFAGMGAGTGGQVFAVGADPAGGELCSTETVCRQSVFEDIPDVFQSADRSDESLCAG